MTARTRSLTPAISRRREGGRTLIELLIALVLSLLIIGAVGMPVGVWAFRQAEAYAKRTGKLKRVG